MVDADEVFRRYRDGEIDYRQFELQTRPRWRRLASMLLSRWRSPSYLTRDDLVQEMLVAAWTAARRWEPGRGPSLKTFVLWTAIDKARKHLHKHRRAGHDGGYAPSRFDMPASALAGPDEDVADLLDRVACLAPGQDVRMAVGEAFDRAGPLRPALAAFAATGEVDEAVAVVLADQAARDELRITTAEHAADDVRSMIEQFAATVSF